MSVACISEFVNTSHC
ncbi:hypothetical protein Zm00014a_043957 [Zea mays]|uniref:Uncharacterized protein n=1 Tax=Zea mays TaxID=4577 RepID=A0A317Y5S1_MAIZE|nr:hypothetical protein Zm00014a_043957 [Zea mays]